MEYVLNRENEEYIADEVLGNIDECGYSPEQAIPGLVLAIIELAEGMDDTDEAIHEARLLLA
jgi:hypothetical protein